MLSFSGGGNCPLPLLCMALEGKQLLVPVIQSFEKSRVEKFGIPV